MSKKVSIITPCYNGQTYLDRYFNSLLSQTYKDIELIFINDGSRDNTYEIYKKYEKQLNKRGIETKYIYQENAGVSEAINKGLKEYSGYYLTWPDSDDEMTEDSLEKRITFLENHPDLSFVCGSSVIIDDDTKKILDIAKPYPLQNEELLEELIFRKKMHVPFGAYLVRSKDLKATLKSNQIINSRLGQNWQLMLPFVLKYKGGFIDDVVFKYYVRNNSISHYESDLNYEIDKQLGHVELLKSILTPLNLFKKYEHQILDKCYTNLLYSANAYKDYNAILKYYDKVKSLRATTLTEKRWYLESKSKIFRTTMIIPKKVRKMIRDASYKR